ncbi:glycoside hydrolase [Dacryopinax primogenitus]|uniref:non-reducing end alpha-L-arabinofuranosidase n=1 Tax=Dacryopinax primogenitus (strain DJM 731) TaxID=1858805 RepID=M5G5X9_DACPD|nr:glycoside hydrolase [Dacryopinax primogenitus]EJU05666.1 glycoside hydrolase [Dacryopinax primogenitus]
MLGSVLTIWALALAASANGQITPPNALNLRITQNMTHTISPTLYLHFLSTPVKLLSIVGRYGYMWEDINHSGDGGLYAELLQNRALQGVIPNTGAALQGWQSINGAFLTVTAGTSGVSSALPNSLQVSIPKTAKGPIRFANTGYWGINVQAGWTYTGSLYVKSPGYCGSVTVALQSASGTIYDSVTLSNVKDTYQKLTFILSPTNSAPDHNNLFTVTVDGAAAAGQTLYFGMFSLFPPTFRGRENGLRMDLAQALFDTSPKLWRFPGGNNLEGQTWEQRWKWNETIGPLENRPGRVGDWGYPNTDGLGLMEYLDWIEDLEAVPILGVWAGVSIGNYSDLPDWPIVPQDQLQPYIDDVINEIHFITDPENTSEWAALRAEYGHPAPYNLTYIEVGNEDQFAPDSYQAYRWQMFVDGINASFPHLSLQFLATSPPSLPLDPPYLKIDFHQYSTPGWFINNSYMFDTYPRNGTQWFMGEYAVTGTETGCELGSPSCGRLLYPTLEGACAEAAFMTGMERNSDVVFASAYAPSLQNVNSYQWTPDIITFSARSVAKSVSYYNQQLFATNLGTHVLATIPEPSPSTAPLYWVASHHATNQLVFLKVVNTGSADLVGNLFFDFPVIGGFGTAQQLSAGLYPTPGVYNISNTLETPDVITPVASSFGIVDSSEFNYTFPQSSITVMTFAVDF